MIANISGTASDEKGPGAATGDGTTMRVVTRIARMPATIAGRTSKVITAVLIKVHHGRISMQHPLN